MGGNIEVENSFGMGRHRGTEVGPTVISTAFLPQSWRKIIIFYSATMRTVLTL